ncbi:cell division protein ZapE [Rhizobium sp. L1K21]|uniref:cell division protein ZapE n=1 Tax=Rhizobium sp. L1K21 TaxID=2954933 RepID=UPI002091E876|nr:cell division protein ZapE [Rhizobium sp. L1K21]MCO6184888.1 cell division protein ZapE [Rhizobium sp. L1K21]
MEPFADYSHSVSERLSALVAAGNLKSDPAQMEAAAAFDTVLGALKAAPLSSKSSALGWLFAKRAKKAHAPEGIYLYGSVGRGKTMLMDMFFELAPVRAKRRAHFHEFMADVHERIHKHRQLLKEGKTKQADPVPPVAAQIRDEAQLLCFDEFTVTDIADAMILSRLFTELFARGCVLVATSNVVPDNLYPDGLNRGLFVPFIAILKEHVKVMSLDARTDYRLEKVKQLPVYITPADERADALMESAWHEVTAGNKASPAEIPMKGRSVRVPMAAGKVARFSFADLCDKPLGASDFLAIAERYHTVFVERIPLLDADKRNETKRFIILIDTLYDHGVRLFATAAAKPEELLVIRRGTEGFEFDRTASRLFEMQSEDYLAEHARKFGES